jgi:hypothetical protein
VASRSGWHQDLNNGLTICVMEILQVLTIDGLGVNDHGGIVRYYEILA